MALSSAIGESPWQLDLKAAEAALQAGQAAISYDESFFV